ncbi:ABC transporter substrate-binding protein [Paenibacillus sp. KQZ6P-2]|uniref:ABC transporter substrate-binding protein n=1 Tax=Paenibacillus mangrovi TaxID=2931978 RepID=A0A9X1WYG7_9BACL|nr:ABC transporter substrate-binding protein [Paenibacillus mangrovi]MCJ8014449.1 ABC transporter substrate-binding protein [Paenibacillus mangrovi]
MKKSRGKKSLILFTSLMLVASMGLSACSSKEKDAASSSGSGDAPKKETVEIQFWNPFETDRSKKVEKIAEEFNASQNEIKVKVLGNQDDQKQLTAISGGAAPDIVITYWNKVGPWAEAGAVLNLDEMIKRDNFDTSQIIPAALDRMKVGDKIYGFPISMSMANKLFYNKKMFADAGITAPPETLEQMFEDAKKLTEKDGSGNITQIGFIPDYPWIDNVFWPIIFGGSWDDGNGKLTANQKANVDSIAYQASYYKEFGNEGIAKFKSGMGKMETPQDPILTGKLGMMIGWENWYIDNRGENGEIGVAPFPYPEAQPELKNAGMVSPVAMFIPAKGKHPEEAWKFMQYLLSEDVQIEYAIAHGSIPILTKALDNPKLTGNEKMKTLKDFLESAKSPNLKGFPNSIYIDEYLQSLNEETEKALLGKISPQEAMDTVVQKMQPIADKDKK